MRYTYELFAVLDSVTDDDDHPLWVRSTGFDEAWEEYPDRPQT